MESTKKGTRRERRGFTTEFKAEAVRMLAERRAVGATATRAAACCQWQRCAAITSSRQSARRAISCSST